MSDFHDVSTDRPHQHVAHRTSDEVAALREALERIAIWCDAYPLEVFPEPDLKMARQLLEAGGMTLDAVSASAMRHCLTGVKAIAWEALK